MPSPEISSSILDCHTGKFELLRWPLLANDRLRAWDAADEYLLRQLAGHEGAPPRTLVLNDSYGALTTALHHWAPVSWSDSYLSHQSGRENLARNRLQYELQAVPSTSTPTGQFDLVIIKIPKTTALLEEQLIALRALIHDDTQVVAAAMIKHLQKSAFGCFERLIGPVTTSLAVKKARLLFAEVDMNLPQVESPYPTVFTDPDLDFQLANHANVFSRDKLDHGARFLLSQFDKLPSVETAVDLACGNGVLGIAVQQLQPTAQLQFLDESYGAVASARDNYQNIFNGKTDAQDTDKPTAEFTVADGLERSQSESVDLIVCNPPFHQQHIVGERIAMEMFKASKRCLKQGGQLWVVANRHLNYATVLKREFGQCQQVAVNKKFVVIKAVKR